MNNQIVIAMDNEIQDGIELIARTEFNEEIYGYKIGSLWILDRGIQILKDLKETVSHDSERKLILDMQKWGTDIPDIIRKQVDKVAPYVDEIIACPMASGKFSLEAFANACRTNNVDPICVVKYTHPSLATIYATGFEAQGGQTKPMVEFGVTKFIVGRAVYEAEYPIKAIENIYKEINEV